VKSERTSAARHEHKQSIGIAVFGLLDGGAYAESPCSGNTAMSTSLPATQQLHKLLMAPGAHHGVEPM
jgi:hypothetical protein